jgi:TATA-binding protein-associated factor Taf7
MACHHSSRQLVEDAWDEKMMVREEPPAKRMKTTVACMQQPLTDPGPLDILFTMALVLGMHAHGVHDAVKETATNQVAETEDDDKEEESDEEEESDKEEESEEEEEEEEEEEDANGIAYA